MKKVLITGITGFVGSHMADYLLANTDWEIHGLKRWRSPTDNIKHMKNVTFHDGDLLDQGSLFRILRETKPDYVLHFAAMSYPTASFYHPSITLQTNTVGTANLLEAIYQTVPKARILSVSTSEVYGMPNSDEIPIKETNPIRAANPYSIGKVGHDLISQYYHKAYGMDIIITRMFSHEGKRRGEQFALSSFAKQLVHMEREEQDRLYVGNLASVRTYAHIDDAIEAYYLALFKGEPGEVYNIGGDYTCSVAHALEVLIQHSDIKDPRIETDPKRLRPTDITLQIPDCTKFKTLTGWEPQKSLEDIAMDLLEYWRKWA